MPYTSEELNNNFYQDNNAYEEIGELHANSKQAVVGRIDSRYNSTKKVSLQSPDSDRLIYNYSSDSKVSDMAIRYAYDNVSEKMMFIGKDFLSIYDSDTGNFVLKEPHDLLSPLVNPFDDKINPGLGGLETSNVTRLNPDQLDYICKNLKYVLAADKNFFIISELNDSSNHSVIWKLDPDTLKISKFRPKDFYDNPGNETILAKPFIYNGVIYIFTKNPRGKVRLWSCYINDNDANSQFVYSDDLEDILGPVDAGCFGYVIDNVNGNDVVKCFNIRGNYGMMSAAHFIIGRVDTAVSYIVKDDTSTIDDYTDTTIKCLKKVTLTNNAHMVMLLNNGIMKVLDNGYSNDTVEVRSRPNTVNNYKAFVKCYENRVGDGNQKLPIIKLYNDNGRCIVLNSDVAPYTYGILASSSAIIDSVEFDGVDELLHIFENKCDIVGFESYDDKTIIYGWFDENGIIKPLIKEINPNKVVYSVEELNASDTEMNRPFDGGLEPDACISIVKDIPFGSTKTVRVKLSPEIGDEAKNSTDLYFREDTDLSKDGKYTTGSVLWNALKQSGIPYNTHINAIGRIILDGYDIPIESVLITRPDESEDYGSVLLSFDKMFDITSLDEKYLKLGNILYPGILFKNNKGFLNDAMISNVYNIDSTFAYDDANNGQIFEDLALSIKTALILKDTDDPIMVVAANNGKISSINLNTGSYITASGNTFGENAPDISSKDIPYNWVKDGEIVTLIKCNSKSSFFILYASGKIVEYKYSSPSNIKVYTNNYVSEENGNTLDTVYCLNGNTLAYYVNDGSKKINMFNLDSDNTTTDIPHVHNVDSVLYTEVNGEIFYPYEGKLYKFNPISGNDVVFATNIPTDVTMICWDFNDRIYVSDGTSLKYIELSTRSVHTRNLGKFNCSKFIVYYDHTLFTYDSVNDCIVKINDNDSIDNTDVSIYPGEVVSKYIGTDGFKIFIDTGSKTGVVNYENRTISFNNYNLSTHTNSSFIYDGQNIKYLSGDVVVNKDFNEIIKTKTNIGFGSGAIEETSLAFLGYINNIMYLIDSTGTVYAKDPHKTLLNYMNKLQSNNITIRTANTKPVTAIGFIDNGNALAICFADGAIESVYIPEYNSSDGYYKSDYGDVNESYARTIFERHTVEEDGTLLKDIPRLAKQGYSFIGWSTSPSEDDYIAINEAVGSEKEFNAGDIIYGVFKDNIEEYTDRCATRMYAKAGEFFNNGVISVDYINGDVIFQSSDKSIRWANDIGVFFEGHDDKFTGKNTTNKGKYNGNELASKLFINGAGSINIGKYVFYINGYNPSNANPQTTVHNGIVVYDAQNDEYSVMSKGTDKLHGTILSRIFPFCYYNNGYIYIFGGLERRDIHTNSGNNYSKFHRTNKIEKIDVRSGEMVLLAGEYGPGDKYRDEANTDLIYAGENEIRYLTRDDNTLNGVSVINEYNKTYNIRFDLNNESCEVNEISEIPEETEYRVAELYGGFNIALVKSSDHFIIDAGTDKTGPIPLTSDISEPVECVLNGKTYLVFIVRSTTQNGVSTSFIGYNRATGAFETLYFVANSEANPQNMDYFAPQDHCNCRIFKTYNISDKEMMIDNTPIVSSSTQDYVYSYGKLVFNKFDLTIEPYENDVRSTWVSKGFNQSIEFIGTDEFLFNIPEDEHKLIIERIDINNGKNTVRVPIKGNYVYTVDGGDDIITCFVTNDEDVITDIVSYNIDKNVAVSRNFANKNCVINPETFFHESITKKIFVGGLNTNTVYCFIGIDVNSVDAEASVGIVTSDIIKTKAYGFTSVDKESVAIHYRDPDKPLNLVTEIWKFDTVDGTLKEKVSTATTKLNCGEETFNDNSIISYVAGKYVIKNYSENAIDFYYVKDSTNIDHVRIMSKEDDDLVTICDILDDRVLYMKGTKRYYAHTIQKEFLSGSNLVPIGKEFSKDDNAHFCDNTTHLFVYVENTIYRIEKSSKTTNVYENIFDSLDEKPTVVGMMANEDDLYIFDGSKSRIIKIDIARKAVVKEIHVNNLVVGSNVVSDRNKDGLYFTIESNLYTINNDELIFLTSGITNTNIVSMKKINDMIRFVEINNSGDIVNVKEVSLNDFSKVTTVYSFNAPVRTDIDVSEYANIGIRQYATNLALDNYGNLIIVGGGRTVADYNPTHITTIESSSYNNFVETLPSNTNNKMISLRSLVDDNYIYSLGIGNDSKINVVFSERNENDYKGCVGFKVGSAADTKQYFTFNNELFAIETFTNTFRILKYDKSTNTFSIYSVENINKNGSYISSHAYSDGTLSAVFLNTVNGEIKLNLVCYNLNTKKEVFNSNEKIYTSLNTNVGSYIHIPGNDSWNGKYFTTIIGTGSTANSVAIMVTINVLKDTDFRVFIKELGNSGKNINDGCIYFNDRVYHFGANNTVYRSRLNDISKETDEIVTVTSESNGGLADGRIGYNNVGFISGSRMLIPGDYDMNEISRVSKRFVKSNSSIKQTTNTSNVIMVLPDNKIGLGDNSFGTSRKPAVYDIAKTPVKSFDFTDDISIKIYSGVNEDTIVSYYAATNDIYDVLTIPREYGSSIKDLVKLNDNSFVIIHADTPRISTLVINSETAKLSFKRYDGLSFGEPVNTGTNIHTIQEADITMLFDSEMDEYAMRQPSI